MAADRKTRVSACIMAQNEEARIARCLASVQWCDEIVVVDGGSHDRTPEICRELGARVVSNPWPGFTLQRRFSLEQVAGPWVLFIDADEEVSAELRGEMERALANPDPEVAGYGVHRTVYHLGRFIRHGEWHVEEKVRLVRAERCRLWGIEPHDHIDVKGRVGRLRGELRHYPYTDLSDQVRRLERYAAISAEQKLRAGKRFRMLDLLFRPPWTFMRGFVLCRGFRDGPVGLVVALTCAYGTFLKYARLWELGRARRDLGSCYYPGLADIPGQHPEPGERIGHGRDEQRP